MPRLLEYKFKVTYEVTIQSQSGESEAWDKVEQAHKDADSIELKDHYEVNPND